MTKILVIEDEQHMRLNILEMLEYEGFETIGAENGHIGVQLAKEHLPDLILCDVVMPELNGYGVLAELHRDPLTATIPFIFLTAQATMDNLREGMNLGADDYLTKPFTIDELLATIQTRLEKHSVVSEHASKQLEDLRLNLSRSLPHELRTPLQGILGLSDLFIVSPQMFSKSNDIIEVGKILQDSALRLQRLVENYLIYANLRLREYTPKSKENERRQEDIEVIKVEHVINVVAVHKAKKAQRQDDLILDLVEAEIRITENDLQKIVEELLDNAFKFSKAGTPIRVATAVNRDQFTLSVTDQGRGMTKEQIANIGAYMQFDRRQYEQQGSGLGLSIARLLTQLHGGELTIESKMNQGTTVNVMFTRCH